MKTFLLVLSMFVALVMTSAAATPGWREMRPLDLQIWLAGRIEAGTPKSAVERLLGKADGVALPEWSSQGDTPVVWVYWLEDGYQLEVALAKEEVSRAMSVYAYGVWKVDGARRRIEIWRSNDPGFKMEEIYRRREMFKGDVPERRYEIRDGGAVG
jgi:hypothetical protein